MQQAAPSRKFRRWIDARDKYAAFGEDLDKFIAAEKTRTRANHAIFALCLPAAVFAAVNFRPEYWPAAIFFLALLVFVVRTLILNALINEKSLKVEPLPDILERALGSYVLGKSGKVTAIEQKDALTFLITFDSYLTTAEITGRLVRTQHRLYGWFVEWSIPRPSCIRAVFSRTKPTRPIPMQPRAKHPKINGFNQSLHEQPQMHEKRGQYDG